MTRMTAEEYVARAWAWLSPFIESRPGVDALKGAMASEFRAATSDRDRLLVALQEAVEIVEGRPDRSPFVAVEDWKKALIGDGL